MSSMDAHWGGHRAINHSARGDRESRLTQSGGTAPDLERGPEPILTWEGGGNLKKKAHPILGPFPDSAPHQYPVRRWGLPQAPNDRSMVPSLQSLPQPPRLMDVGSGSFPSAGRPVRRRPHDGRRRLGPGPGKGPGPRRTRRSRRPIRPAPPPSAVAPGRAHGRPTCPQAPPNARSLRSGGGPLDPQLLPHHCRPNLMGHPERTAEAWRSGSGTPARARSAQ